MSDKKGSTPKQRRRKAYSFEIILDGVPQDSSLPFYALDEISRHLCDTISLYYIQHIDEYRRLLNSGNARPVE